MRYSISRVRIFVRPFNQFISYRAHHRAAGKFTTIGPQGTPVTREIEVWLGDPKEAYVMLRPEISRAFQAGAIMQGICSPGQDPESFPLIFHHTTRRFSHKLSPYPQLEIPQDLPRQSNANSSPATLHTFGVTHAITLDGTPDANFESNIRDSLHRLQPVLDKLKDN